MVADGARQLHLPQVIEENSGKLILNYRFWEEDQWSDADNQVIGQVPKFQIDSLAAAIKSNGRLGVLYTGRELDTQSEIPKNQLFFTSRTIS